MHSNDKSRVEKEGRKIETFLDGLAKQIKAFEDATGHKLAMNVAAYVSGNEEFHTPFTYCRDADMVCSGCGEIHNGGTPIQATFLNTLDVSPDLSPIKGQKEDWMEAVRECVRKYDPSYPNGGPNAFVVQEGSTRFGPDHESNAPQDPMLLMANMMKQLSGPGGVSGYMDIELPEDQNISDVLGGVEGTEMNEDDLPPALQNIVDAMRQSGGVVKIVRLDGGNEGPDSTPPKGHLH